MKFTKDKLEKAFAELTEQEGFPQHMYISISHKREEVLIEEDLQTFLLSQYAGQGITINETQSIILQLKFLSASNLHENNKTFLKMMGGTTVKENYLNSVVTDYIRQVEKKSKRVKNIQLPKDQFVAEKFEQNGFKHIFTYERLLGNKAMPTQTPLQTI